MSEQQQQPVDITGRGRAVGLLRRYGWVLAMVVLVTALHYNTAIHIHSAHGIYRRLYYFPIILAAFRGATRGGLGAALLVCALYIPHAFGVIGFDPAPTLEKILEMGLYLGVGGLSGTLVARINATHRRLEHTAENLRTALDEKTAMEAQLIRSARLATVGRLSAGLAHEIRNPLASIQGSAEVLKDDYPDDHPKAGLLRILLDEAGRLNNVLSRFLDFARSEPAERRAFDLQTEVAAVIEVIRQRNDAPEIVLAEPTTAAAVVLANRQQIRQVLLNLILNAVQAGGPDGCVSVDIESTDQGIRCRIIDTGPGFSAEAVENFGTPFYSTKTDGTGLGLATSLRIVEDSGGTLEVDPRHAGGGCVVLSLPAVPDAPATDHIGKHTASRKAG